MSELRTVSTAYLLRRVAAARAAGEPERARPEWVECVIRATPRVRAAVGAFRTVHGDRVRPPDRDAVVYDALERACRRMLHTLESLEERSLDAAMVGCAHNACKDHFRRLGQHERHFGGSLDEAAHEDGEGGRFDRELARAADARRADDDAAFEAADRLARALPQMRSAQQRRALELREAGCEYEEIAHELGVSVEYAYQLYSRGLRDLRGLITP